ncbi:hypothetical protein I317_02949 [Kwoniella heveanensis CBS 569]|uniref:PWI domain-containing protein n=1 Tax=Kwoniella heveanensis BCC8398 TaxID=1296120 RepID=A0A1B9GLD7_9TREE|nr:hypothetical protein I316_06470 [Kwoniella heveanensis BCC8398]OCF43239.1 hypothetical protein I317_02949 [Kwoniella heveanensis CBS 569]
MYNGQPPFRPPGNLPPFPPSRPPTNPNGAPIQPPPGGFPPFRPPPAGFVPPPFPPNFAPGSRPPPTLPIGSPAPGQGQGPSPNHGHGYSPSPNHGPGHGYGPGPGGPGGPNGLPTRPPPSGPGMGYAPRPAHPGLGLPPAPAGLPQAPRFAAAETPTPSQSSPGTPPGFVKDVKTTSVFVGSIAPGITDKTLHELLNACGPLHELKRVVGASGKPQAFGFASFENPEVVLRCIRCLNGVELPDMTPEGRREGKPAKKLVVKADQKTQEFLEEFESTLGRSENDEEADAACRKSIQHIVALLTDPNAQHPDGPKNNGGGDSPLQVIVPAHLQDLQEGDLPEEQRVAVLDQIAIFRENAARREKEKKAMEDEKERFKQMQAQQGPGRGTPGGGGTSGGATSNYGYGNNRALGKQQQQAEMRGWGQQTPASHGQQTPLPHQNGAGPSKVRDPQAYDKPVGFVPAQSAESKVDSGRTDEEEEEIRRQRRQREKDIALRDAERRVENRERGRIEALNRELGHRKAQADLIERNRRRQEDQYENWDDDEIMERGRELFYADRATWRARRARIRQKEYQDDVRDRQQEEDEQAALERESEEFLKKQMAELAELETAQKARGLLTEDAAPIKVAIQAPVIEIKPKEEKKLAVAPPRPVAFGGEEADDDEESERKKKRAFIRLDADGDGEGTTEAERIARRNAKLLDIKKDIPSNRRSLWRIEIEWAALRESVVQNKIKPFVQNKITDFLGELDQDLADFVLEHIKDKKGADDLVDGLEPILAEDAESFVIQLWRLLAFESAAYKAGLDSGSMMP